MIEPPSRSSRQSGPQAFFIDLVIYVSVMFLIREVYFSEIGFIANGLMWSLTTLVVATWRMKARGVSWRDLGLCRPKSYKVALIAAASILGLAVGLVILFVVMKDQLAVGIAPDNSGESAVSKFGELHGNWIRFLVIFQATIFRNDQ